MESNQVAAATTTAAIMAASRGTTTALRDVFEARIMKLELLKIFKGDSSTL